MKRFIKYIIQYFTHWQVIAIAKEKGSFLKLGKWYKCEYYFTINNKGNDLLVEDINIREVEKCPIKKIV